MNKTKTSLGCLLAFLLPFMAVGVGTGILSIRAALKPDWAQAGFLAVFALLFGGAGFGLFAAGIAGTRIQRQAEDLESQYPNEPWRWRPEWAGGRIRDGGKGGAISAAVFAIFWNLIAIPTGFLAGREALVNHNTAALLGLLFPAIGIGLLFWAVRSAIRLEKFGISTLELATFPGVIGREIAGVVHTARAIDPAGGFRLKLRSIRRHTTGSGKNRSTSESILWEDEQTVPGAQREDVGVAIPFLMPLPADVSPSDWRNSNDVLLWRLTLSAEVPGVDYESSFEVPVFRTAESDQPRTPEEQAAATVPVADYRQPPGSPIQVTSGPRGMELYFPPARNPGAAAWLTVFTLIFGGVLWLLIQSRAGFFFEAIWSLIVVLLLWGTLYLWLASRRSLVSHTTVEVTSGIAGLSSKGGMAAADVAQVTTSIGMQSGDTVYYDIKAVAKDGRKLTLGSGIPDKGEAEWLAEKIRGAMKD